MASTSPVFGWMATKAPLCPCKAFSAANCKGIFFIAEADICRAGEKAPVFIAIDHCSAECVGIHAAQRATRFEALEPIRQGVRDHFGGFARNIARGLAVRHDHGSQYMADAFQNRIRGAGSWGLGGPPKNAGGYAPLSTIRYGE